MTHCLREKHPDSPWHAPLVMTLRYRCDCGKNEVITISAVLDFNAPDHQLEFAIKNMLRDVRFEVEQHIKGAA